MCGITGVLDPSHQLPGAELAATVRAMSDELRHRGPDDGGVYVDADAGVALGHRRLSILDLSEAGHQPMRSSTGRYVITFNGEIYNFAELSAELAALGHAFRGHSDTEVMLAAFTEWGVERAVRRFNGMFAFAVWDAEQRVLFLARDRLGEKPLYYGWVGKALVFGSELKALRAHPAFTGDVDRGALALYFRLSCVPAPHTIYRGIRKLPPGKLLTVRANGLLRCDDPVPYWSAREVAPSGTSACMRSLTALRRSLSSSSTMTSAGSSSGAAAPRSATSRADQ